MLFTLQINFQKAHNWPITIIEKNKEEWVVSLLNNLITISFFVTQLLSMNGFGRTRTGPEKPRPLLACTMACFLDPFDLWKRSKD